MMLLPILVAAGLANAPPAVMQGIQLYQLQHGQSVVGSLSRHEELFQGQANEDALRRSTAFERCAVSAAAPLRQAYGQAAIDQARFELIGSKYRENGGLRVYVTASPARLGSGNHLARTVDISCDIDPSGNLRRLDLGKVG